MSTGMPLKVAQRMCREVLKGAQCLPARVAPAWALQSPSLQYVDGQTDGSALVVSHESATQMIQSR